MNPHPHPQTVKDVFIDFEGRRAAIINALTKNVDQFYQLCNPNLHTLCLYGFPDQHWEVNPPSPNSDLPDPKSGVNLVRDSMNKHQWLSMVALHCDAWLHSVASYFAVKLKLDNSDRKRLFNKIADVCSVLEAINCETRKRKRKYIDGIWAEELLVEILSRVPVRDVIRYRSVCKRWRSLIDDPGFVSTHLRNYKSNCEGTHLLVIEYHGEKQVFIRCSDTFRKVMQLSYGLKDKGGKTTCLYYGYVNGVMLIKLGRFRKLDCITLWNPSINASLDITNSKFLRFVEGTLFVLGLGFDASLNDLKVVAIIYPHSDSSHYVSGRYRGNVPGLVQVYRLSTKSWSGYIGVHPPPYWSKGTQVFMNGGIHWTNLGPEIRHGDSWLEVRDSHMVSFDVRNEVFSYFELPSEVVEDHDGVRIIDKFPIVLEGSLGMFYKYNFHSEVWVMDEYGVPNSWNKRYKFNLQIVKFLHFKGNGELVFALHDKDIKLYDAKRNLVRDLAKNYSWSGYNRIYAYVESLLLRC